MKGLVKLLISILFIAVSWYFAYWWTGSVFGIFIVLKDILIIDILIFTVLGLLTLAGKLYWYIKDKHEKR